MWITKNVNAGYIYQFIDESGKVLATYNIVDYSTEQGTMYLVHRAENTAKAAWTDTIVQAWAVCQQDYKARIK